MGCWFCLIGFTLMELYPKFRKTLPKEYNNVVESRNSNTFITVK